MTKDEIYTKALTGIQLESQKYYELRQHLAGVYKALEELGKDGLVFELAEASGEPKNKLEWPKWIDGKLYETEEEFNELNPKPEAKLPAKTLIPAGK